MQNIDKILSDMNQNQLREISQFLNSVQGKQFKNKINSSDKEKLLREFAKLDPQKVNNTLKGMSTQQLISLIKKL